MNFETLKLGFIKYLEEINSKKAEGEEKLEIDSLSKSIFSYTKEFKEYLETIDYGDKNVIEDMEVLISSELFDELLEEINAEEETEETLPAESEETETVIENGDELAQEETLDVTEEDEENVLFGIIGDLFKDEEFKSLVDADENGTIEEEELFNLINTINANDEDFTNLSLDDIVIASENYNNDKLVIKTAEEIEAEKIEKTQKPAQTPNMPNGNGGTGGNMGGIGNNTYSSNNTPDVPKEDVLKEAVNTAQGNLNTEKEELASIQEGTDSRLVELKEQADKSFDEYTKKLEELNPQKAEQLKLLTQNKETIEANNNGIEAQNQVISECDLSLGNINSRRQTLNAQKNELNAAITDENEKFIRKQLDGLEAELGQLDEEERLLNDKKTAGQTEITRLEGENKKLEAEGTTIDEQIKKLEEEISKIENDDLQAAKEQYEADKQAFEDKKAELIAAAQTDVNNATKDLEAAQQALAEYQNQQAEKKYTPNLMAQAVEWARQHDDKNQSEMRDVFSEEGYAFHTGAWCADFVAMALYEGVGKENLPDWYTDNNLNRAYCPSLQNAAKGHEIKADEAQVGDMVLFDWDGDGSADHVGLFVGINEDGTIETIEGNTSNQTTGAGSSVEEKGRNKGTILGIYSMTV